MDEFILRMTEVFKALSDPTRLKVIRLVATKKEYLFVAEIAAKLGISNSAVSQHLKVLKNVNIVKPKRQGYKVYYEINRDMVEAFEEDINKLTKLVFIPCQFDGPCIECPLEKRCNL
jgi:ArsR family transcriptional regulator